MFKETKLFLCLNFVIQISWSNPPDDFKRANTVYRVDSRSPEQIKQAGGMRPRASEGLVPDDDLAHHFDGESVVGGRSNFVSTTGDIRQAIDHSFNALGNSTTGYVWIYEIRPDNNFYNVNASIIDVSQNAVTEDQRNRAQYLIRSYYTGMDEYAARGGFDYNRIIRTYGPLTEELIDSLSREDDLVLANSTFWENQGLLQRNHDYHSGYDYNQTSSDLYPYVGMLGNTIFQVENNYGEGLPITHTCLGVSNQNPSSKSKRSNGVCSASLDIRKVPYYENWLKRLKVLIELDD
jgi:pertussis toxin subunit 1